MLSFSISRFLHLALRNWQTIQKTQKTKGKVKTNHFRKFNHCRYNSMYLFLHFRTNGSFALVLIKTLKNSAPPSHHGLYLFQNLDNLWTLQRVVVHVRLRNWLFSNMVSGCLSLFKASDIYQNCDQKSLWNK